MKKYCVICPGWIYSGTFYGKNERQCRENVRKWIGCNKLPKGTKIWEDE